MRTDFSALFPSLVPWSPPSLQTGDAKPSVSNDVSHGAITAKLFLMAPRMLPQRRLLASPTQTAKNTTFALLALAV